MFLLVNLIGNILLCVNFSFIFLQKKCQFFSKYNNSLRYYYEINFLHLLYMLIYELYELNPYTYTAHARAKVCRVQIENRFFMYIYSRLSFFTPYSFNKLAYLNILNEAKELKTVEKSLLLVNLFRFFF